MDRVKMGDLEVIQEISDASSKTAVILLHGFGADFADLAPLCNYLDTKNKLDWYFPNGKFGLENMGMPGRCWYDLNVESWMSRALSGDFASLYENLPHNLESAINSLVSLYETLEEKYDSIVIGGFSQGSIITGQLLNRINTDKLKGVLLLSSAMINFPNWKKEIEKVNKNFFVFQSHGKFDEIIPFQVGVDMNNFLTDAGFEVNFLPFDGGHEIPLPVLQAMKEKLEI